MKHLLHLKQMKPLISPKRLAVLMLSALAGFPISLPARTLIEAGSGAGADPKAAVSEQAVSARFRREFDATGLKPDERLVILVAASDGEIVYLNGREVGRVNMPQGTVDAKTTALAPVDEKKKGMFVRLKVPPDAVHPNAKNVIDTEVHSAKADGSRLTFDLELKTLPADQPMPPPSGMAKQVLETFRKTNYIAPGTLIPDGYFDGGRHMALDAEDHATSGREILVVDRSHDPELAKDLEFARTLRNLPPMDRAHKLSLYVDKVLTPAGGRNLLMPAMEELQHDYLNKPLRIGDVCDQYHAGVCRHRSLIFKVLADEAGLKTALVRGNYVHLHAGGSGAHAWNELQLDDGHRYLVDTTLHPKDEFPDITSPSVTSVEVAKRYVKPDGTPYYGVAAH
jgi:hypothetical protein